MTYSQSIAVPSASGTYDQLTPYVVNLNQGQFASDGMFVSSKSTVDTIFANIAASGKKHVVFYAHGGLVSEQSALDEVVAAKDWWLLNSVYPVFFVWHTGFMEVLGAILSHSAAVKDKANVVAASPNRHAGDPVIEFLVRALGGRSIWSAIKTDAELASKPDAGATYVAQTLADQLAPGKSLEGIRVHAVGHSAGSVFHSFFVPTAISLGVKKFDSLQFLAPAITTDNFTTRLLPYLSPQATEIGRFTMFTMRDYWEQLDNCAGIYEKSLLYLVSFACEHLRGQELLGLEKTVIANPDLVKLFGIPNPVGTADLNSNGKSAIVWSTTVATTGDARTEATCHGCFPTDIETMQSVVWRVLQTAGGNVRAPVIPPTADTSQAANYTHQFALPYVGEEPPVSPQIAHKLRAELMRR